MPSSRGARPVAAATAGNSLTMVATPRTARPRTGRRARTAALGGATRERTALQAPIADLRATFARLYADKGIAFAVSGGLLVYAAATRDVSTATGLDGAMNAIGAVPTGQWLLTAVAVGFAAFGVYALARARYPDRDPAT